ncbi:MAG: hypothetical protein ACRDRJ_33570, partial [Streptosporangiaceae bacterium]
GVGTPDSSTGPRNRPATNTWNGSTQREFTINPLSGKLGADHTCFEAVQHREGKKDVVARFGGIPLRHDRRAVIVDPAPAPVSYPARELIWRLRRRYCELCERGATVSVHHVAALRELGKPGPGQPAWAALMARMRRKTLIVCADCHAWIHSAPVTHAA